MKINLSTIAVNSKEIFHRLRWNGTVACPKCGSVHVYNPQVGRLHICGDCSYRFSDTSNTIFHSTKLALSKWLYAIYLFLETTRGVSSYTLSRLIGVSQPTAWNMLMKIRKSINHDIKVDDSVILDEVFLGADWKRIPSFKKYQKATPPKPVWNLKGEHLRRYYKSEFYRLASADKIPVLGISSYKERKLTLLTIPTPNRKEFVREQINHLFEGVLSQPHPSVHPVVITDHGKCYNCISEFLDENNQQVFQHEVCRHDRNRFASPNGYSSNRIESSFAHLKRMWRGVYQFWSKKYNQYYLNEFSFRYSYGQYSLTDRLKKLFSYFDRELRWTDT